MLKLKKTYLSLLLNIAFCFMGLMLFYVAPEKYSYSFNLLLLLIFLMHNFFYFIFNRVGIGFEIFFFLSFLLCNFVYPVFYYVDNPYTSMFVFGFNEYIINKCTALAYVGYSFYILGVTNYSKNTYILHDENKIDKNVFYIIFFLSLLSFLIYVSVGGLQHLKDVYNGAGAVWGEVGLISYISIFSTSYTILLACFVFNTNLNKLMKLATLSYLILVVLLFLSTGSRTFPLMILLILFVTFNYFVRRVPILIFLMLVFVAAVFMYLLLIFRELGMSDEGSFELAINSLRNSGSIFDIFMDVISNNRNLYVLVDFTNSYSSVGLLNVSSEILSILPASGFLVSYFNVPSFMIAGQLPTYLEFGEGSLYGLGTNMVGEAYLSFKLLGVVIVFLFFGLIVKKVKNKAVHNIYYFVVFLCFVGNSVFMSRADYLYSIRQYFWIVIFLFFVVFFVKKVLRLR